MTFEDDRAEARRALEELAVTFKLALLPLLRIAGRLMRPRLDWVVVERKLRERLEELKAKRPS